MVVNDDYWPLSPGDVPGAPQVVYDMTGDVSDDDEDMFEQAPSLDGSEALFRLWFDNGGDDDDLSTEPYEDSDDTWDELSTDAPEDTDLDDLSTDSPEDESEMSGDDPADSDCEDVQGRVSEGAHVDAELDEPPGAK